ncbi:MAG: hypothetical protein OEW58_13685 [Gammaproteobacteria bacterium]|nr:hypothetical protein [Gammaproteobacteria bacterium]
MASNIATNFSAMQQINQTVNQLASAQRNNRSMVVQHMDRVQQETSQTAGKVVSNALEMEAKSAEIKGRMIDLMA